MNTYRRAALSALVSFALVGCATKPFQQPLKRDVATAIQPVDVKLGISQPELNAAFERSKAGSGAAAACGAIPGIGILLAAACGGTMGAVDAKVNASRAQAADEIARPLKDEIVDVKFDQLMGESLTKSLQGVPGMQISGVAVTKTVNNKAYEELFRASTSSAVMFINVEYHLSTDFSTVEISARSTVYPRSASARTAAGQPAALPTEPNDPALSLKNTVYRSDVFYHGKLPVETGTPSEYVAAWKADSARLLRAGLQEGVAQVSRLLAEDLQRVPGTEHTTLAKVDAGQGLMADLVSDNNGKRLLRYPNGSLHLKTTLSATSATPDAAPIRTTATTDASGAATQ